LAAWQGRGGRLLRVSAGRGSVDRGGADRRGGIPPSHARGQWRLMNEHAVRKNRRTFLKGTASVATLGMAASGQRRAGPAETGAFGKGAVRATGFEARTVYRSSQRPGYACWVSFFPGEHG